MSEKVFECPVCNERYGEFAIYSHVFHEHLKADELSDMWLRICVCGDRFSSAMYFQSHIERYGTNLQFHWMQNMLGVTDTDEEET